MTRRSSSDIWRLRAAVVPPMSKLDMFAIFMVFKSARFMGAILLLLVLILIVFFFFAMAGFGLRGTFLTAGVTNVGGGGGNCCNCWGWWWGWRDDVIVDTVLVVMVAAGGEGTGWWSGGPNDTGSMLGLRRSSNSMVEVAKTSMGDSSTEFQGLQP